MVKQAACLSVLGTGSDVGKSIVNTALCRILANRGIRVAPYKAQNMSNNSGVTPEGLEIGRAQIVQAEACRIAPHVDMNPVLLKPTTDVGSQVVLHGTAWKNTSAASYYEQKAYLQVESQAAMDRLRARYEVVVMEGAGSCAEVNLLKNDIVNLRAAAAVNAPVILVADIDRGGVFAQIVGTLACLSEEEQQQIKGFVINRFRGDISLFKPGIDWIEEKTGKPVFGVLPWFTDFTIEAEDSVVLEGLGTTQAPSDKEARLGKIGIIRTPRIANFTDFAPLEQVEGLAVQYMHSPDEIHGCKALILPGSKSTRSDLAWLRSQGWQEAIDSFLAQGGHVLGVCAGYQMLGQKVHDPYGLEGDPGSSPGLGLLPVETTLQSPKTTTLSKFTWQEAAGSGYEIHMGTTEGLGTPLFAVQQRNQKDCQEQDGRISSSGQVIGTYMHGLFDMPAITRKWLQHIGLPDIDIADCHGPAARDAAYDQLAAHMEKYLDVEAILALLPEEVVAAKGKKQ